MLCFLFRNPSRSLARIATAGLASVFDVDLRIRARFSIPVSSPSSPLPLFQNQQWSSTEYVDENFAEEYEEKQNWNRNYEFNIKYQAASDSSLVPFSCNAVNYKNDWQLTTPFTHCSSHNLQEMENVDDMKNETAKMREEINELKKMLKSCMEWQSKVQDTIKYEVSSAIRQSVASDHSYKDDTDEMEENPECIRGCLGRNAIARAADKAGPAVVSICSAYRFDGRFISRFIRLFVRMRSGTIVDPDEPIMLMNGKGSGAIIDPDGTILTCAHLVVDSRGSTLLSKWRKCSDEVVVKLQDGREYVGNVINVDRHSDIAIVKIKSKTPFPYLKVGNSRRLRSGDWVVAVGCPFELENTFTAGIVSCVDRKRRLGHKGILNVILEEHLQIDCALNMGNSGGPLVNLDGEIVGINTHGIGKSYGLNFAVPIESAMKIIEHFKKNGRVVRPWLGLEMLDLNDLIIQHHKERDASFSDVSKGVQVLTVTPRSPGGRAGFHRGDVIIEFEGKPVKSSKEILEIMGDRVGVKIEARVMRANNKEVSLTVVPVEANLDRGRCPLF